MAKNVIIQTRFSEENVVAIRAKTKLSGMSLSGFVRMATLSYLSGSVTPVVDSTDLVDDNVVYGIDFVKVPGIDTGDYIEADSSELEKVENVNGKIKYKNSDGRFYVISENNGVKFKEFIK